MSINTQMKVSGQPGGIRMICGRVDVSGGTPSAAVGEDYSVVDAAAGQVKVVLSKPGKSILSAVATPIEGTDATGHSVKVDAKTEASDVTFGVYVADGTDGALVDNVGFYFQIIVKDMA
jgi:hypothetical protein